MKVMLLAAGLGKRLRPLTELTPKPLLRVGRCSLIEHHLYALGEQGFTDVIVNYSYQTQLFESVLGQGDRYGVQIQYSQEPIGGLETGGGIRNALPLLGDEPFIVINADIWTDFQFDRLPRLIHQSAHVVLVDNREHKPTGDFDVKDGLLTNDNKHWTYSGIGVFKPEMFSSRPEKRFPLGPIIQDYADKKLITAEIYEGAWLDVGTPERFKLACALAKRQRAS